MSELDKIRKKLGHLSHAWVPQAYLDTGSTHLNGVLGERVKGIAYGRILEIAGMPSNGKTALVIDLAATAQNDGACVVWDDFENSFDRDWAARRGLKVGPSDPFELIQPYVGQFGKEAQKRLVTGEELLEETERLLAVLHKKYAKIFLAVDSVAAILPEDEGAAGIGGQNMKTNMALPVLLGKLLRRWTALMQTYGCIVVFINQLRTNPMAWGDNSYTPGGNALPFYAHVRARMRRVKGGRILGKNGQVAGLKGLLSNHKNKAGGIEFEQCGFKLFFNGTTKFMPAKLVKEEK